TSSQTSPALLPFRLTLSIEELTNPSEVAEMHPTHRDRLTNPQCYSEKDDYVTRLRLHRDYAPETISTTTPRVTLLQTFDEAVDDGCHTNQGTTS
ncbi:5538_t:CDS:1, partial [Paraglomus brasilianum]